MHEELLCCMMEFIGLLPQWRHTPFCTPNACISRSDRNEDVVFRSRDRRRHAVDEHRALPIEPRSLTWNIVSDRERSRLCRDQGLGQNCEGMAAWDKDFRMCVNWTRSPR